MIRNNHNHKSASRMTFSRSGDRFQSSARQTGRQWCKEYSWESVLLWGKTKFKDHLNIYRFKISTKKTDVMTVICVFPLKSIHRRTCAGLSHPRIGLLGAQVFPNHLLQRAHEHGNEAIDVAGVITAGWLQDHQRSFEDKWKKEGERHKKAERALFLQGTLADIQLLLILNTRQSIGSQCFTEAGAGYWNERC